jgi:uncharacterized RmlC-like cupin family protein
MRPSPGPARRGRIRLPLGLALLAALAAVPVAGDAAESACTYLTRTIALQPGAALLLASYPAAEPGPLQHAAFLYDNAVAVIALVACGQAVQARRIGDAILLALAHDRHWHDGRLRNAYAAGAVDASPLKLAGWWDAQRALWLEDDYQAGSDCGNMAWAMLALLTLDAEARARAADHAQTRYALGALGIAQWLQGQRDARGAGGFTGGSFGPDSAPQRLLWKSTEHNVDLATAFERLASAISQTRWRSQAQGAQQFVAAMWDAQRGGFAAGTTADGLTVNPLLALDAQIWPLLALPQAVSRYTQVLPRAEQRFRAGQGYAYSEAGGGPWTEGTAQVLLLLKLLHRQALLAAPEAAIAAARAPDGGYYATTVAALPTGFMLDTDPDKPRLYLHLEHLGAAAWVALAELGFNPFTGSRSLPP